MMKLALSLILSGMLILALAACSTDEPVPASCSDGCARPRCGANFCASPCSTAHRSACGAGPGIRA